jgi:DNA-directed RNA polymerase, mitochondrial
LDVLQEALARGIALPGLEVEALPPKPVKLDDAAWNALSAETRSAHKAKRRKAHEDRAEILARHCAMMERLMVAQRVRDAERIWFPHTLDFRGRLYPIPMAGPHPQGDDLARALIQFADGMPLGPDGLFWLCVRAANTYGKDGDKDIDKLSLEERVQWTLDHQTQIEEAAGSPLSCAWWTKAEEPWSFLATCYELAQLVSCSTTDQEQFVSHLPIPMDGSCNGLQHLSAMGLDPVGAKATNLMPGPRQDIYVVIAERVAAAVEKDAAAGVVEALHWHGRVTRKVVKRAVMTTPYGVTDGGIRKQLIDDGLIPEDADKGPAANYMRTLIVRALTEEVGAARSIMASLQTTALRLAEAGLPFEWATPTGSRVRQAYQALDIQDVVTLVAQLHVAKPTEELLPKKQYLGSAPNYVHSFDAAHLSMTVAAAHEEGVTDFAMIHDSYATHAGNTTKLAAIPREQFVKIYERDWLSELCAQIRDNHPHVDIPEPPARGTFDITQVLKSPFFFS